MRTAGKEAGGWRFALGYPKNLKEMWWTMLLFLARIHVWSIVFLDVYLGKEKGLWKRIESTK